MNVFDIHPQAHFVKFVAVLACVLSFATTALSATPSTPVVAGAQDRAKVEAFVERNDVRRHLELIGVDPARVESKVAKLSDDDARYLAEGVDAFSVSDGTMSLALVVAVALLLAFVVTDAYGITNIFPSVSRHTKP